MQRTLPEPSSHRMTQHSPVTTRLTIILQYCGKAQKPKSSCSINLKGAKSSQWCHRSGVLFYSKLTPSAIRRDSNNAIVIFRIAGVQTVQKQSHNITNTKIQEFSIDSQIQNQLNSKYRWFVSSRGAGTDVVYYMVAMSLQKYNVISVLTSVPMQRDAPCAETKMANQHLMLCLISLSFYM